MPLILPESTNLLTEASDQTLQGLSPDTLLHEIKRLENCISRLKDSNDQIQQFCQQEQILADQERIELNKACQDNLGTVSKQEALVAKLASILSTKTGGTHYSIGKSPQAASGADLPSNST